MRFCIAVGCGKTRQKNNVRICSFPADQQRCDEWIEACGRTDFRGFCAQKLHHSTSFGLCELHFTDEQWCNPLYKPSGLRPDAVPTVFNYEPRSDGSLFIPTRRPYRRKTGDSPPSTIHIKRTYHKRKLMLESGEQGELCEWSEQDDEQQHEQCQRSECNKEHFDGVVSNEVIVAADKSPQNIKRKYYRQKIDKTQHSTVSMSVQLTDNNVCEVDLLEMSDCANTLTALNNSLTATTIQTTGHTPDTLVFPVSGTTGTTGTVCTVHSGTGQSVTGSECVTDCCGLSASNPFLLQLQYKLSKAKEQKQYLTYQLRVERSKTKRLEKKVATLVEQLKRFQSVNR